MSHKSNKVTTVTSNATSGNGMVYIILGSNPANTDMYVDNVALMDASATTPTSTPTATPTRHTDGDDNA